MKCKFSTDLGRLACAAMPLKILQKAISILAIVDREVIEGVADFVRRRILTLSAKIPRGISH
jgi:hypothetical protein